jgi:hypothetical protein
VGSSVVKREPAPKVSLVGDVGVADLENDPAASFVRRRQDDWELLMRFAPNRPECINSLALGKACRSIWMESETTWRLRGGDRSNRWRPCDCTKRAAPSGPLNATDQPQGLLRVSSQVGHGSRHLRTAKPMVRSHTWDRARRTGAQAPRVRGQTVSSPRSLRSAQSAA